MFSEKYESQIPALQLLAASGWTILPAPEADRLRNGKRSNVLLEAVLTRKLQVLNSINHKGGVYKFSEANIQDAVQRLKNMPYDGLLRTNEKIYDLLTLGCALEQNIEGDQRSFQLQYIDWRHPEANAFHAVAELPVERRGTHETVRPDILLFVNGIPFVSIECKAPSEEIEQAISQTLRNQQEEYVPRLFTYIQLTLALNRQKAFYGTVGTPRKFWAVWREKSDAPETLKNLINTPLLPAQNDAIFSGPFASARADFEERAALPREVTAQDETLYALCRPERLLELAWRFIVFDGLERKIARYQQYFTVNSILERIQTFTSDGSRKGGVVWHTQGSGKSLTMVMLVRSLMLCSGIPNPRVVLVTDRDDLDKQLGNTFRACSLEPVRATSGKHLLELAKSDKAAIITTLIQKFDKALKSRSEKIDSPNIFLLVDEGHRSNYGPLAGKMRMMFSRGCYIGFTGTPLAKKNKNSFEKFGGLIRPVYSIRTAVEDKAVVPLLYEGRHVDLEQNRKALDLWFERHTKDLSDEQRRDLKKKFARAEMLKKSKAFVYMCAYDISEHFRDFWQGTGFKAQLVAPDKETAILYQQYLNELGVVSSEVIISAPDTREGNDPEGRVSPDVVEFWKRMMARFGNKEDEYNKQIIDAFKTASTPEILIVVDKLLTGFDVPRNTVMYLCRSIREPATLLQAIARVNRLCENKEFGYIIDYAGVLDLLDDALLKYSEMEGVSEEDLTSQVMPIADEIAKLPQQYAKLWEMFKSVRNSNDSEAFELLLQPEDLREAFYENLNAFAKTLELALSSIKFMRETPEEQIEKYKRDLKRFWNLRSAVKRRYAEAVNYRDYEPKIKKLLDTHIQANEVIQLNEPVNIFDENTFREVLENQGIDHVKEQSAMADSVAHATKRYITEHMEEDPAFYHKFSEMIQQAIDEFREKRLHDLEHLDEIVRAYWEKVNHIRRMVTTRTHDDIPETIRHREDAMACYGLLLPFLNNQEELTAEDALQISDIINSFTSRIQFWDDADAQNQLKNAIDDFLYDEVMAKQKINLTTAQMDEIIERLITLARNRSMRS